MYVTIVSKEHIAANPIALLDYRNNQYAVYQFYEDTEAGIARLVREYMESVVVVSRSALPASSAKQRAVISLANIGRGFGEFHRRALSALGANHRVSGSVEAVVKAYFDGKVAGNNAMGFVMADALNAYGFEMNSVVGGESADEQGDGTVDDSGGGTDVSTDTGADSSGGGAGNADDQGDSGYSGDPVNPGGDPVDHPGNDPVVTVVTLESDIAEAVHDPKIEEKLRSAGIVTVGDLVKMHTNGTKVPGIGTARMREIEEGLRTHGFID